MIELGQAEKAEQYFELGPILQRSIAVADEKKEEKKGPNAMKKGWEWFWHKPFLSKVGLVLVAWVALQILGFSRFVRENYDQGRVLVSNMGRVSQMMPSVTRVITTEPESQLPQTTDRIPIYNGTEINNLDHWYKIELKEDEFRVLEFPDGSKSRIDWRPGKDCNACFDPLDGRTRPDGKPAHIWVREGRTKIDDWERGRVFGAKALLWGRGTVYFLITP